MSTDPVQPPAPKIQEGHDEVGVSVRITGGLGNQMFQYAAARALSLRLGVSLTLDLRFFDRGRHRRYGLDALPLAPHSLVGHHGVGRWERLIAPLRSARLRLLGRAGVVYREPHFHVDEAFFALRAPVRLEGHFQSERYFVSTGETIQRELMPPVADDQLSREVARAMAVGPAAALHVRRGDYLTEQKNRALFAQCGPAYYATAMARLPANCTVFVFSDDMAWCREQLPRTRPLLFVDNGQPRNPLNDLWLMTRAHHHVIANSSLSWWGAWLGRRKDSSAAHTTIAPLQWFVDARLNDSDLIPEGWTRM